MEYEIDVHVSCGGSLDHFWDDLVPHRVHTSLFDGSEEDMEQMVDVPVPGRIPSVGSERIVEQVVDSPVPGRFSSVGSERIAVQVVDSPVPGRFSSDDTVRIVEQVVDAPGLRADALTSRAAAASLDNPQDRLHAVFRTFPQNTKSATKGPESSAPLGAHSSSSTPAAHGPDDLVFPRMLIWQSEDTFFCRGHVWCVRLEPSLLKCYFWRKDEGRSQWQPPWLP